MFFWQASAETEKYTDVRLRDQTVLDITSGMILSNLIGYFIMITTATTLHSHGIHVDSVREAALALQPVAGRATFALYTLGIIGSGLIAIPVLSAASSYAVAEAMAWRRGLENRPWQARRFYVVLSGALLLVALLSYLPFDTVKLAFWSQVFWGVLAPPILLLLLFLERRQSQRKVQITSGMRSWLGAAVVLSAVVAVLTLAL
jgi:Mn2+/Fe2+ NRAMP family transporter